MPPTRKDQPTPARTGGGKMDVKLFQRKVEIWKRKTGQTLLKAIRVNVIKQTLAGVDATGRSFTPYRTPDLEGLPVDLSETGEMLTLRIRTSKKGIGRISSKAGYAKFHQFGTKSAADRDREIEEMEPGRRRTALRKARKRFKYKRKTADGGWAKKPGGAVPARPWLALRKKDRRTIESFLAKTLEKGMKAQSLREVLSYFGQV